MPKVPKQILLVQFLTEKKKIIWSNGQKLPKIKENLFYQSKTPQKDPKNQKDNIDNNDNIDS